MAGGQSAAAVCVCAGRAVRCAVPSVVPAAGPRCGASAPSPAAAAAAASPPPLRRRSYWGRRAFERHFKEWRHINGMKALGIPNNKDFFEVTKIDDALALWKNIQVRAAPPAGGLVARSV